MASVGTRKVEKKENCTSTIKATSYFGNAWFHITITFGRVNFSARAGLPRLC